MIHTSHSLSDTKALAESFVNYLSSLSSLSSAMVVGFSGDLGSGKTAFTQAVAKKLGITSHVTSPTFVIQKKYPIGIDGAHQYQFKTLIHIDAYRIESLQEFEMLGFKKEFQDPDNLIIIEWPERVIEALPPNTSIVHFSFVSEHVRTIQFPAMMAL